MIHFYITMSNSATVDTATGSNSGLSALKKLQNEDIYIEWV